MKLPGQRADRYPAGVLGKTGWRRKLSSKNVIMSRQEIICICIGYFLKAIGLLVLIYMVTAARP
jgi:hypothetical protein